MYIELISSYYISLLQKIGGLCLILVEYEGVVWVGEAPRDVVAMASQR